MKLNKINEVLNSAKWIFGLLSSRNFATMATWRNDLSSLLYIEKDEKVRSVHKGEVVGEIRLTIWISKSNAKSKNEFRPWISVGFGFGFGVSSERVGGGGHSGHPHPTQPKQYCKTTSTWRHNSLIDGQEQKHFSPLGTELYFHVNSLRKNSLVTTPNISALLRGCKPRILATII